ncbi:hypothetical protein L1D34_10355 [Vibrio mediterranei]|jgi:hypothetical protein|uniref:hypothetical protein n=1 Tax=Vibrio mediterranei TaxID=689 RepID=UPI001EFE6A89|nr:hypothetical protein [Vibrio mediterranei]MCG9625243.1 hypothetical protein [Vibrio mediterranei]MCY9855309.1 hypothetical protein [Vibrio mediterranei]
MKTTLSAAQIKQLNDFCRNRSASSQEHVKNDNQLMANYDAGCARALLDVFGMLSEPEVW